MHMFYQNCLFLKIFPKAAHIFIYFLNNINQMNELNIFKIERQKSDFINLLNNIRMAKFQDRKQMYFDEGGGKASSFIRKLLMIGYLLNSVSGAFDMTATQNSEVYSIPMGDDNCANNDVIYSFDTNADDILVIGGETSSRKFVTANSVMDIHLTAVAPNSATCFDDNRRFSFVQASRADGTVMWIKFFPFDYSSNQAYDDYGYSKFKAPLVAFPKPGTWDPTDQTTDPPFATASGYLLVSFNSTPGTSVLMNVADGSIVSTHTPGNHGLLLFQEVIDASGTNYFSFSAAFSEYKLMSLNVLTGDVKYSKGSSTPFYVVGWQALVYHKGFLYAGGNLQQTWWNYDHNYPLIAKIDPYADGAIWTYHRNMKLDEGGESSINLMETHYTGATDVIWAVSTYAQAVDKFFSPMPTMELVVYKIQTTEQPKVEMDYQGFRWLRYTCSSDLAVGNCCDQDNVCQVQAACNGTAESLTSTCRANVADHPWQSDKAKRNGNFADGSSEYVHAYKVGNTPISDYTLLNLQYYPQADYLSIVFRHGSSLQEMRIEAIYHGISTTSYWTQVVKNLVGNYLSNSFSYLPDTVAVSSAVKISVKTISKVCQDGDCSISLAKYTSSQGGSILVAGSAKKLHFNSGTYPLTSGGQYTIYVAPATLSEIDYEQAWAIQKYSQVYNGNNYMIRIGAVRSLSSCVSSSVAVA